MRNVSKVLMAADDGAAVNANEVTQAIALNNANFAVGVTMGAAGTWGGGTATLQIDPAGDGTWISSGLTLNANGKQLLQIPCKAARWSLAGATAPSLTFPCAFVAVD